MGLSERATLMDLVDACTQTSEEMLEIKVVKYMDAAVACSFLHYHRGGEYKDSTPLGSAPALSVDAEGAAVEYILSSLVPLPFPYLHA